MKAIWKYPLVITDTQSVWMPAGAELLTAQEQNGMLCLWALVNPTAELRQHAIYVVGTGNPTYMDAADYVGTVQMAGGMLVWHVFAERLR
jgi:hypothetical protein